MALRCSALENTPRVAIVRGSAVSPVHYLQILAILMQNWATADPYLDDFARVMRNSGDDMLVRLSDGRVDGVLRTKEIRSLGNPHLVPGSFEELVGPYWSHRDRFADTRILVDLTKREGATGVARSLVAACLNTSREPHVATFSPEHSVPLHEHFSAYPIRRIENGRPRHSSPDVVLMRYRGFTGFAPRQVRHPVPVPEHAA